MPKSIQLMRDGRVVKPKSVRVITVDDFKSPFIRSESEAMSFPEADVDGLELSTPVLAFDVRWQVGSVVPT